MIIYLTIYFITLCLCIITYVWVRHERRKQRENLKRTIKREVALEDAISPYIEPEIPLSWSQYANYRRMRALRNAIIPYDEVRQTQAITHIKTDKEDFLPNKVMKVHKLDQGIRKETYRRPGIYIREVDVSYYNNFRNRENE